MSKEIILNNGDKLIVNLAEWEASSQLKKAIQSALLKNGIKLTDQTELMNIILAVDSDSEVEKAFFECLKRCTYNGEAINQNLFNHEKPRSNYYQIMYECFQVNLGPFLKSLFSVLSNQIGENKESRILPQK